MNASTIAALCTGIAGVLTALAALLHSVNTRAAITSAVKPVPAKDANDTNAN
jgi:hypothetical protein